jgi:hypothetical protein
LSKFAIALGLAAALMIEPALSADMAVKAPPAPVAASWTGFYVGASLSRAFSPVGQITF